MYQIVRFCRSRNILCQGRGSAANSAVCYCLGVTAVDPVRMDLLFVVFIGTVLGLERVGALGWCTLPVMLVGLGLLAEVQHFDLGGHIIGDAMVVGGALALAINAFIIRRILQGGGAEVVHLGHNRSVREVVDTAVQEDVQGIADLNLIAHRIAELSLNPGLVAQDGFLTSHVIESLRLPEPDLIREYLGDPADIIDSPTPGQVLTFGEKRRRIPEMFDLDYPALLGSVQNQDAYMQGVAAQRPFYFDHVRELTDRAMEEYAELTGRRYARVMGYRMEDAQYVLLGQGSVVSNAEAVADYLRAERGLKVGVVDIAMFRPFRLLRAVSMYMRLQRSELSSVSR